MIGALSFDLGTSYFKATMFGADGRFRAMVR